MRRHFVGVTTALLVAGYVTPSHSGLPVFYLHLNCLLPLITAALKCNRAACGMPHTWLALLLISAAGLLKYAMIRRCLCRDSFRSSNAKVIKYTFKIFTLRQSAYVCVCACVLVCVSASLCLPQRGQLVHAHVNAKNNRPPVCMLMSPPTMCSLCLPASLSLRTSLRSSLRTSLRPPVY